MKFFIPSSPDNAEDILKATRTFVAEQSNNALTERRIFKLKYRHNGDEYLAEVGKRESRRDFGGGPSESVGPTVLIILESIKPGPYFVCTLERGVAKGFPVLVGASDVLEIEDFDED